MAVLLIIVILFILWKIYETIYYKGNRFLDIKSKIQVYIQNCNELNVHIEELKNTYIGFNQLDYGNSIYYDKSYFNYKRPELKNQKYAPYIHN